MSNGADGALDVLLPSERETLIELVEEAGIDVTPWSFTKNGKPVATPKTNPAFCYDWAFGGGAEPTALCVWHEDLKLVGQDVVYDGNLRAFVAQLAAEMARNVGDRGFASRAQSQIRRSRKFDAAVSQAFQNGKTIRVILVKGKAISDGIAKESSNVQLRALDPAPWAVHSYDAASGTFRLVRGGVPGGAGGHEAPPLYIDQFDLLPERTTVSISVRERSTRMRRRVLERAKGYCEFCRAEGFPTADGRIYLETHHVVPLGEGGDDADWNMMAVCANDHRRAHHALERDDIKRRMIDFLAAKFPNVRSRLERPL